MWPRRKNGVGLRILDVGGHSSTLKQFLPEAHVVCADPKKRPDFAHRDTVPFLCDAYVQALGGSLPFQDSTFDVATAHDTLEHVPDSAKERFVRDLFRVARKFVILNGPMMEPLTTEAEHRIVSYWRRGMGWRDHPLEEHSENRLPLKKLAARLLTEEGTGFAEIPNGDVHLWLTMFALKSYLLTLPDAERLDEVVDRVYNSVIGPQDFGGDCYRVAYVAAKREQGSSAVVRVRREFQSLIDSGADRRTNRDLVLTLVSELEEHARHVRRTSGAMQETIANLRNLVEDKEAALRDKDSLLVVTQAGLDAKDAVLLQKNEELRRREGLLAKRDALLLDQNALLAQQSTTLGEMETRLTDQEEAANEAVRDLEIIRGSAGFRLLQGTRRVLHRLFPPGSLRGKPYRALYRVMTRLLNWRVRKRSERVRARGPIVAPVNYPQWIESWEPGSEHLLAQRQQAGTLAYRPKFSLLLPIWNPDPPLLRQTLASILEQTYENWEICIADGASNRQVQRVLNSLDDSRIHIRKLSQNLGISGNTNEALSIATGEFVVFVDHTDLLAPNALFEVALALNRDPSLDILYSAHDLVSMKGERLNPFFPPTWSPELLFSVNYLAHLLVMRRSVMEEAAGLRSEFDGAQDWDLLLRVSEHTNRVGHIPAILYHWRADPSSAVFSLEAKPYAKAAQERAVGEALDRRGIPGRVERQRDGTLRIRWEQSDAPIVSVVIPTKHNRNLLSRCLDAIAESTYSRLEVVVVETAGRTEERERWYRELETPFSLRVLWWDGPFNYSAVNNLAAHDVHGEILLFLNDDTEPITADWLEEMVGWVTQDEVGAVGAQLIGLDGAIQHGGVVIGMGGFADHMFRGMKPGEWSLAGSTSWYRDVTGVTGACLMVRRDVFDQVGGWNESFLLCGGDVELCLRIRDAGHRIVCTPYAQLRHLESATRGSFVPPEDFATSYWYYQPYLFGGDPYYNPNLSLQVGPPQLRSADDPSPLEVVSGILDRDLVPKSAPHDSTGEAIGFTRILEARDEEIIAVQHLHVESHGNEEVTSINWFVPDFESPFYGGIHTVFRFANHFLEQFGVKSRFVVIGTGPERFIRSGLRQAFPALANSEVYLAPHGSEDEMAAVPWADVSISTLWVTCYPLLRFRSTGGKFYLIQDFEPMFYPAGTVHALAEQTYRMGFYGICNTPTLKGIYEQQYGGRAVGFMPAVDPIFHPGNGNGSSDPYTVFFYGRPGHPRNCYELAIEALRGLKEELKDQVRIVTAGAWSGADERTDTSFVETLGLLEYRKTAELYRGCDAGLVLSVSKHPSYLPMQLMASGSLVVSNVNPAGSWLLRHEENCLLAPPTADALREALVRGLLDRELRHRLTSRAITDIRESFSDWTAPMNDVYRFLCNPNGDI